jgi:hypothetical protein
MANFAVNPFRFVPGGLTLDDRPVPVHMVVPVEAPLFHGDYSIAVANWDVPDMLEDLVSLLRYD